MKTRVVDIADGIPLALERLDAGDIVALPTETVYGLGADALNPRACAKIFQAKARPLSDPLIVHLPDPGWMERLAVPSPLAEKLAARFWPGPLTIVLPRQSCVPDIVTAGQDTVALRVSAHPVFQVVIEHFGKPIAAPSANRFGRISPTRAAHVLAELDGQVPLILDGGTCDHGIESTIVLVRDDGMRILRHGPVTAGDLKKIGPVQDDAPGVAAPGGLKSHYAPATPLVISVGKPVPRGRSGLLAWAHSGEGFERVERLSVALDPREAAANFYAALRRLDGAGLDIIVAEPIPERGLGMAIMERLRKAAAR